MKRLDFMHQDICGPYMTDSWKGGVKKLGVFSRGFQSSFIELLIF